MLFDATTINTSAALHNLELVELRELAVIAMSESAEGGPCCCQCWRWHVFGGLGKLLIRNNGFDAGRVAKVWDLSDGCGGDSHIH